jgi:CpeT/CpcT family (DUF1001)
VLNNGVKSSLKFKGSNFRTVLENLGNLAKNLAGEFSNKDQAIADPVWYVHLRLWQRPVPQLDRVLGGIGLFAEQANVLNLDKPYRQRLLCLQELQGQIQIRVFAMQDPGAWRGAGTNSAHLAEMRETDLEFLPGCTLTVKLIDQITPARYRAELPQDAKCCFIYNNEERQAILGFESNGTEFWSYDRGINPETKAAIWGAIAGAYHYQKLTDFGSELS